MKLYSKPTSDNKLSGHLRKVNDYIGQTELTDNDGIVIEQGPSGTNINKATDYKNPQIIYRGEYSTSSFYRDMDMVNVLTGSTYVSGGVSFTMDTGVWLCIKSTPTITSSSYASLDDKYKKYYNSDSIIKTGEIYAPVTPTKGYWIQMGGGGQPIWI